MENNEELLKNINNEKIAEGGSKIYEEVKDQYIEYKGKFLAIDVESKDVYLADNSADAVVLARKEHPGKVFYVVKIGFSVAETLANLEAQDL